MAIMVRIGDDTVGEPFQEAADRPATETTRWLGARQSMAMDQRQNDQSESAGHQSGRSIVDILHKRQSDYTADDIAQIRRVISDVHRHLAQQPSDDVSESHWRYSLMD